MTLAQATRTLRGLYQALLPKYPQARVSIQPYSEPTGYALLVDLGGQDIHRLEDITNIENMEQMSGAADHMLGTPPDGLEERYWGGSLRKEN